MKLNFWPFRYKLKGILDLDDKKKKRQKLIEYAKKEHLPFDESRVEGGGEPALNYLESELFKCEQSHNRFVVITMISSLGVLASVFGWYL